MMTMAEVMEEGGTAEAMEKELPLTLVFGQENTKSSIKVSPLENTIAMLNTNANT